jgi:hypothetical protein
MNRAATTVAQYLASLPDDRRAAIQAVREVLLANLDDGYEEGLSYGMIGYCVPHSVYPPGYHCDPKQPLPFACLASQKGHMTLHLMGLYMGSTDAAPNEHLRRFQAAWAKTGKKLDMGKACIRFKRLEDLPLQVIGDTVRRLPSSKYIELYEAALGDRRKPAPKGKEPAGAAARKASAKKPAARSGRRTAAGGASQRAAGKAPARKASARR